MKQIILYAVALIITVSTANAQKLADYRFKSMMQNVAEEAVKSGLFIIRQDYVIKRNSDGLTFGLDNRPEFGTTYSLAVKATNGYIISEPAVKPWHHDKNYDQLQEKEKYTPIILQTQITPLQDSAIYSRIDISNSAKFDNKQQLWFIKQADTSKETFPDFQAGNSGYTVWITVDEKQDLSINTAAKFWFTTDSIAFDKPTIIKQNFTNEKILGGIFVIPAYPKIGEVQFQLAAIIVPDGDCWAAIPFPKVKRSTSLNLTPTENPPSKNDDDKNKKKTKKN